MTFLNPVLLGAAALISIPLLIHLLRRQKLPVIKWAAMEFLRQSQSKLRRRVRIEELLLLLLRMTIIALVVLALARPVLRSISLPIISQNSRVYAVIVIDNSYSMGQSSERGVTAWTATKQAVHQLLTRILRPGDSVSVLLMNHTVKPLIESPTYDLRMADAQVKNAPLSFNSTDFTAGARAALALVHGAAAPVKEVYFFTDDQKSGMTSAAGQQMVWQQLSKAAHIVWVSAMSQTSEVPNLALHVRAPSRELVTANLPARLETVISNYSGISRNITLQLQLDGAPPGAPQSIEVPAYGKQSVAFTPYLPQPGIHTGSISIANSASIDGLATDNSASFVLHSRSNIPVLVQDMSPAFGGSSSSSFYLYTALQPDSTSHIFAPTLIEGRLGAVNLSRYSCVIITGITTLSANEVQALIHYVSAGGGLLIFPGPATNAVSLNSLAAKLLPAKLTAKMTSSPDQPLTLDSGSITDDPSLDIFRDASILNIGDAAFNTYFNLVPSNPIDSASAPRVLVKFSNGKPAVVSSTLGLGKVVLFASTADTRWNNLPARGAYLPLLYQIVTSLAAGPQSHVNLALDTPAVLSLPIAFSGRSVTITRPDGRHSVIPTVLGPNGVTVQYSDTDMPGIYQVTAPGYRDAFAVTLPSGEGDLRRMTNTQAFLEQEGVKAASITVVNNPNQLAAAVKLSRYGSEIWRSLVVAAMFLLGVESLLARLIGRRG